MSDLQNKSPISIKEIANSYKNSSSFPKDKIPKELTIYHDYIFNMLSEKPRKEHVQENNINFFPYLIFDDKYKKVSINGKDMVKGWKKNQEDDTSDFFDNFKGKFNQSEVNNFKRNFEMVCSNSVNLSVVNDRLFDYKENPQMLKNPTSVDEFFSTAFEDGFVQSNTYLKLPLVECIYRVNEKINYPANKPLWYVYHDEAESSYGPLSTEDIEQMINSKLLLVDSKIRLIDVFLYRGCQQFEFFKLRDIQLDNFADSITVSNLAFNFKIKRGDSVDNRISKFFLI